MEGTWISASLRGTKISRKASDLDQILYKREVNIYCVKALRSGGCWLEQLVRIVLADRKRLNLIGRKQGITFFPVPAVQLAPIKAPFPVS